MNPVSGQGGGPDARLDVVLCWHMHQPDYRLDGEWRRPWTWLHAIKDYTDMAAHLEALPAARAVVNFSPVLLRQLQALRRGLRAARVARAGGAPTPGKPVGDLLLDALAGYPVTDEPALQRALLRAHPEHMAGRFPAYRDLARRAEAALDAGGYLPPDLRDELLVRYVLCWCGESLRGDPRIAGLADRSGPLGAAGREAVFDCVADAVETLVPRYRALAEQGRVELSVTPYSHPILPLLLDFRSASEAMPDAPLPGGAYPGGAARADWQILRSIEVFEDLFGHRPAGCWPSEGAVSEATLAALSRHGFRWTASGSQVLRHSLPADPAFAHLRPWRLDAAPDIACYFRDDALSDRIGFVYSTWAADDAVADFVRHLEDLARHVPEGEPAVLPIIMDGENAWEYYPRNGWAFLQALYRAFEGHPRLRLTTFRDALDRVPARTLGRLIAGSWVHGTFSTWIGSPARNRAWDRLVEAKTAVDEVLGGPAGADPGKRAGIEEQLAVCEASDWCWWLDESNDHPDVDDFERLYRAQLARLYRAAGLRPPASLDQSLITADRAPGDATESTMRRSGAVE